VSARVFAAVDLGASSGRVMAGTVDGDHVSVDTVYRFPNAIIEIDGHLRWNFTGLYNEVVAGLARVEQAASIGIDTWGVDYGLLDAGGSLLAEPISYRDDRTTNVVDDVHAAVTPDELYAINGLQFLPFNTIYQLAAEQRGPNWERAAHAVLLPDLLAYWLTGALRTEVTNASTTGLLDARTMAWSAELLERLRIPVTLLPPLASPGEVRGSTDDGIPVTTVGSHDTASAVVAVPATTSRFAYVSSGTWSLVGVELAAPVLTPAARAGNFTNELGVDGRTRFLRNVGGLWLLEECLLAWRRNDRERLLLDAARLPPNGPRVDVDDPSFIPPGGMPERIRAAAGRGAMGPAEIVRCILDSLADAYARAVRDAEHLAGVSVDVVHIVGGGSQNALLCQLTADAAQLPVVAGPVEATAVGNVVVQARAHGGHASLEAMRAGIAASSRLLRYEPKRLR
jgi:rhamnulokinase